MTLIGCLDSDNDLELSHLHMISLSFDYHLLPEFSLELGDEVKLSEFEYFKFPDRPPLLPLVLDHFY